MRPLLLAVAGALLLTGCASAPPAPAGLPKIGNVAEFAAKVNGAMLAKKTASHHGVFIDPDSAKFSVRAQGRLRLAPGGQVDSYLAAEATAWPFTLVTVPEGTFVWSKESAEDNQSQPWLQARGDDDPELAYTAEPLKHGMSWLTEPSRQLGLLGSVGKLDSAADDELNRKPTVKYTFTVELRRAAEATTDRTAKARLTDRVDKGWTTAKHEVWLDADHLPVRWWVQQTREGSTPATTDIQYQDWGKPVEITAPPAHQIR
ncbi:hypothetical protein M8C13_30770 [Crossiella sp. SN42]|uniref:hypothetical protein n=1 Tax=Crossiella sp. SN42 TaxID=2944808 RepID=UPI00207CD053|nr:hypothetical protein [Crossiella sp. SN42]MCO1580147.1 hypothetical protein [Crossiella sp. SN42]